MSFADLDPTLGREHGLGRTLRTVSVLYTGFLPFDQDQDGKSEPNTSQILAKQYAKSTRRMTVDHPSGKTVRATIRGKVLDVTWSRERTGDEKKRGEPGAADALEDEIRVRRPDVVICTGMGGDRFRAERQARDEDRVGYADNRGKKFDGVARRQFTPNYSHEDAYLFSTLPVSEIESEWKRLGVRYREQSYDAGQFVCEDVFYRAMWLQSRTAEGKQILAAGFIHVPNDAKKPELEKAIDVVLRCTLQALDPARLGATDP